MSTANLGLQGCAFMRAAMEARFEEAVGGCGSMAAVRQQLQTVDGLAEAWQASVQVPITAMGERLSQLTWKGKKVSGDAAACVPGLPAAALL